jgi:hypothetical protein
MVPGGAGFRITTVTRKNAVIDSFEPTDAMGRQRQDIARDLAGDIDRYNDLLDSSKQRIQTAHPNSGRSVRTSLTTISGIGPITTSGLAWAIDDLTAAESSGTGQTKIV